MPRRKRNAYISYTVDEVLACEAVTYVIQVGSDLFDSDGKGGWFFNKKSAIKHYNKILRVLTEQMNTGTKKERKNAKRVIENLKILPLRLH